LSTPPFSISAITQNYESFVKARLVFVRGSGREVIQENFLVDTGFNRDFLVDMTELPLIERIGAKAVESDVTVGDARRVLVKTCVGFLDTIGNHQFESSYRVSVGFIPRIHRPLMGLRIMRKWVSEFHGPQGRVSFFEVSED
jgi:hypothetical protein